MRIGYRFALIAIILLFVIVSYYSKQQEVIHIAFVGPLSGKDTAAGKAMTQAIQLYLDTVNQTGGIQGKKIVLDRFDDRNDVNQAQAKAMEIAKQNRAVAVIGHWYSSSSISAGEIYKKQGIPAIAPGSTNIKVTENNEWYFRNIFSSKSSGRFLANYVKQVFQQTTVSIIHEDDAYGAYLAEVFGQETNKLGMTVKYQWHFKIDDPQLETSLEQIVKQLATKNDAGVILLAVKALEGVKLVKLIKDAGIKNTMISESSLSEQTFLQGFDNFPKERSSPGYYTNDIYVATPLIFDTANDKAQQFREVYQARYREEPDWSAAYAYDTAMLLVEAITHTQIQGQPQTLTADRQQIRDYLASLTTIHKAIEGVTGFNYFDEDRNSQKPVVIGVYKNKNLISAFTQLQMIPNLNAIADLEEALHQERILLVDNKYMYKTNVVYTGIEINEISDLDIKNLTCQLDFYLWFRFREEIDPKNIKFLNEVEPIVLTEPQVTEKWGAMTYHMYHVKGRFRIDFLPQHYAFKQHNLGVSFRHRELNSNNLIYVTDVLGMGLTDQAAWLKRLESYQVLNPALGWSMQNIRFFQDFIYKSALGSLKYLNQQDGMMKYSRFNAALLIKADEFALRGMIPTEWASPLIIFSILMLLFLILLETKKTLIYLPRFILGNTKRVRLLPSLYKIWRDNSSHFSISYVIWLLQASCAAILLLSSEVLLVERVAKGTLYKPDLVITFFDILWWLVPTLFISMAIKRFIWYPLEKRSRRAIPNVIRIFVTFVIYLLAFFGIIAFVYEQTLTSLLATSGMVAMIIGLAIQVNLSNIFSGVAINLERPFRVGDWVKIGDFDEGIVVDVNWRTTRVKVRNGYILSIPNSTAAESDIHNYNYTDGHYWLWPTVYVDPHHSPAFVEKILLEAIQSVETGVMKKPKPYILFAGVNEWAASYWIVFCLENYQNKYDILNEVWRKVWQQMQQAGIMFAIHRQEIYMFQGVKERRPTTIPNEWPILKTPNPDK
ncbi:MscS Mechanosensitive ion channel [Thioploca ingrica]|uniref:MscS Mechanosensitive ion channel n=1 Tax=Thioploca ingrica TaxID=40754 RepID=A0A090AHQ6_9GAMM|nr:MscS Mechanosensitive ion channel [Thioploca ingrica]